MFKMTPKTEQIFNEARKVILYQDDALKTLSTVFYYHLESMLRMQVHNSQNEILKLLFLGQEKPSSSYAQAPIFLTGKTGSGKTHIIKQLCKMHDVNFLAINSSNLSNAGYRGYTLADAGANLLQLANQDRTKAEFSVVFFDEFDKLFLDADQTANLGLYHRSLVTEILTIIEGTTPFPVKDDTGIDSSKMLFFLGGSFNLHQADEKPTIGFTGEKQLQQNPNSQLKLTDYGLPDELAGRIGRVIAMREIEEHLMINILLESPNSPFAIFRNKLAMVNCTVEIDNAVLENLLIQQRDAIKKFGVRGMFQGFNELPQLVEILYDAPNFPYSHYILTKKGFEIIRDEKGLSSIQMHEIMKELKLKEHQQKLKRQEELCDIPF